LKLTINADLKETLKPELLALNKSLERTAKETDGFLGDLLSYVLIGSGKRIRPALVHLGSHLGSGDSLKIRVVAEAVELIHIATLIHDDVIDKAAMRRGRNTVVSEHGVDTAVLLGDHVYTRAFANVAALGEPLILNLMAQSTSVMCSGEINQLKSRYQFNLSEEEYLSFIRKKTASLFGVSIRSGAILAGQDRLLQRAVESFGVNLGIAFQITDDLLDLIGEEAIVGKTLRTDLLNGKMTLPLIHYRDRLSSKSSLDQLLESIKTPNGQISELVEKMNESGSIAYAEERAQGFINQSLEDLAVLSPSEAKDHLISLTEMLLSRKA